MASQTHMKPNLWLVLIQMAPLVEIDQKPLDNSPTNRVTLSYLRRVLFGVSAAVRAADDSARGQGLL